MQKIFLICTIFILSLIPIFGQNTKVKSEMSKSFRKFEVIKIDKKLLREKVKAGESFRIKDYELTLVPNDLRSPNYKSVAIGSNGDRELENQTITTYEGTLTGDSKAEVRFTVTDTIVEGFLYSGTEKIFISDARKFSSSADEEDLVIYRLEDIIGLDSLDIGQDMIIPTNVSTESTPTPETPSAFSDGTAPPVILNPLAVMREIEVATEADSSYVQMYGNAAAANANILQKINIADGIYERDLNLTISVTYQHAWETTDPYPGGSGVPMLAAFKDYWNSNYSSVQRDTAQLFTAKSGGESYGYGDSVCRNPQFAYGMVGIIDAHQSILFAHEVGHNIGAGHVASESDCASSIMNQNVSEGMNRFCSISKAEITNYIAVNNSCLSVVDISTPTIRSSSSTVAAGGRLPINFSGVTSPSITDWIGVYNVGDGASNYLSFVYTSSGTHSRDSVALSSGTVSVTFPTTPGQYELRLNRNSGFTTIATSSTITVTSATAATPTPTPISTTSRTNVALSSNGAVATASSQFSSSFSPYLAINSVRNWAKGGGGWKDATADSYPDWLQIDFSESKTIDEISVFVVPDDFGSGVDPTENATFTIYGLKSFDVQYWNGASWITVPNGSITNNNKVRTKLLFSAVTTTRIRVLVNSSLTSNSRIVELEAWGVAGSGVTPTPNTAVTTLTPSSSTIAPDGTLSVRFSGVSNPSIYDWIGVFNVGGGDFEYFSYKYTSSGTTSVGSTAATSGTAQIMFPSASGQYELRLNRNNGATRVVAYSPITVTNTATTTTPIPTTSVTPAPTPNLTPSPVPTPTPVPSVNGYYSPSVYGNSLDVYFNGVSSPSTTDWVGVYRVGAETGHYIYRNYTSSGTPSPGATAMSSGAFTVYVNLAPGDYELLLHRYDGSTIIAASPAITVY